MLLDPYHLEPPVSLNRVQIVDLPGVDLDPEVRGKTGYRLLASAGLTDVLRDHAVSLGLDLALEDGDLLAAFWQRYDDLPPDGLAAVVRRMGRNLGWLLVALRRGDEVNRSARGEWHFSYWDHWATVRHVWIGGGIGAGRFGAALCDHARGVLADQGFGDMTVQPSPYGVHLPLIGMGRRAPADCRLALLLDFGQTRVKRGGAAFQDGAFVALDLLPAVPTMPFGADSEVDPHALLAWMGHTIAASWHATAQVQGAPPAAILASVAAYMRDGQPLTAQRGIYMHLAHLGDNAAQVLRAWLRDQHRIDAPLRLEHDGTAAATAHAGTPHSAVITIGTALGIGFPHPDDRDLRPVAAHFRLS